MDRERQELQTEIAKKRNALMRDRLTSMEKLPNKKNFLYSCYSRRLMSAICLVSIDTRLCYAREPRSAKPAKPGPMSFTMAENFVTFSNRNAPTNALGLPLGCHSRNWKP